MAPMTDAPMAKALATRLNLGPESTGEAQGQLLELAAWPLYSAAQFDAAALPRELEVFNYTQGQRVSSNAAAPAIASQIHTNMLAIRTIPRPKTFTVFGVRVIVPPLAITTAPALADPTSGVALENNDQVDDLQLLLATQALTFEIGEKKYLEAPLWMLPANVGPGGVAASSVSNTNAASIFQTRVALSTCGLAYHFNTGRKPVIWNQQSIRCAFSCQWATNPSLVDSKLVYVVFDGILGREIQ